MIRLFVVIYFAVAAGFVQANFVSERIDYGYPTNNGYYGFADYFIEFSNNQLIVSSAIQFFPQAGVTEFQLDDKKSIWELGIESVWSEQFDIVRNGTERFPILIDVLYEGPVFNHYVTIRPGPAQSYEFLWDTWDTGRVAAHEFGHMLGLFDEYPEGGTDPNGEIIDYGGIMGSTNSSAVTRARYYEDFLSWFAGKDMAGLYSLAPHIDDYTPYSFLTQIPEPGTLALLAIGLAGLGWRRR